MSNLLSRLEEAVMPSKDVPICLDRNLLTERDDAMRILASASRRRSSDAQDGSLSDDRMAGGNAAVAAARATVADIEARIRAKSIVIRITGVDRNEYNGFFLACPPRKGRNEPFDSSKFYMYVASKTGKYVDENGKVHDMTDAEWASIDKKITDGEHDRIAKAVLEVNREIGATDLGFLDVGSETTRDSFGISASPATSASHPAASGDGKPKRSTPK